jgi:hypothetical protein
MRPALGQPGRPRESFRAVITALGLLEHAATLEEAAVTDSDLTISILREIRDELREIRGEVKITNERVDVLTERQGETNHRLEVVEHTVADAAQQILLLARYVKNKHEAGLDELRERVTRLEVKAGT